MIEPNEVQTGEAVARHYDDLDKFYREIWGEHVHHGFWRTGRETADEAVRELVSLVAERGALRPGGAVCDIGCGYGGTARLLAEKYSARVTGLTLSPAQYAFARAQSGDAGNPKFLLRDWMDNGLPAGAFDLAVSIESSEHMPDKPRFFSEAHRVLAPGGRLVVCAWLSRESPRPWEVRHLLEPICREGRLPGMGTASEYERWIAEAGFELVSVDDVSSRVKRTWPVCAARAVEGLARRADYRAYLLSPDNPNRVFAWTVLRIWAAYETGSMRYAVFAAHKPHQK